MSTELSELQAQMYLVDIERRNFILGQLELRKKLLAKLKEGIEDPLEEQQYRDAVRMVSFNIQRFRVEGLLE